MAGKEFRVDVNVGVEGQEAGAGDVLAVPVGLVAVGGLAVGGDGVEVVLVGHFGQVDGDNPFDAVAGWAAEEELGGEVFVTQEGVVEDLPLLDVVEIHAEEAGVLDEGAVGPGREGSAEGAVVEVGALIETGTLEVREAAELGGLLAGIVAADVVEGIDKGNGLVRDGVGDRSLEEGESDESGVAGCGGLDVLGAVGAVAVLQVEVQVFVDGEEEFLADFLPVELGEVEAVAGRNGVELVFVAGDFRGEFLVRVDLLVPDVEGGGAPGVGVAANAAIPSGDFYYGLAGVELAKDVGVDAGAVVGLGKDGVAGDHSSPSRSLKSCMAISTSTTIFLPFCMQAGARKPSL